MKNTIHKKSFLNALILLAFGLLLMLPIGCQSDFEETDTTQVKQQNFKTRTIPLSEIANGQNEIRNFIKATNEASSDSRTSIPGAIFDERNIMEATDNSGITNYSTKFNYVNDPENIFYNLVLNVLPNGQKTSYIFKYICDPQYFQSYKLSNYNYNYFVGTTEMKNYIDPTTQTGTNKTSADCEPVLIPSPTPNTNNSGTANGGTASGSTTPMGVNTTIVGYTVNNYVSNISVSWGGNTSYTGGVTSTAGSAPSHCSCISMGGGMFIFCFGEVRDPHHHKNGNIKAKTDTYNPDCIKNTTPLGLVPVNNIVAASYDLKTILNLTRDQYRSLAGREYVAVDLKNYVVNHWTDEGKAFAVQLIIQMMQNNSSPDSVQEVINILDILDDGLVNGQPVVVGPTTPITNMAEYLNCFNPYLPATITIYADQPKTGTHNLYSNTERVGHAFISITQGIKVKTLGFYPQGSVSALIPNALTIQPNDFLSTPGVFGNDSGHPFDVSLSLPLNPNDLASVLNGIISVAQNNPQYNLGAMNCTDLALMIFNSEVIMEIPNCEAPSAWSGQTPGTLGEVIRNLDLPPGIGGVRNVNGGNAPINNPN